jgi:hypothetical protein
MKINLHDMSKSTYVCGVGFKIKKMINKTRNILVLIGIVLFNTINIQAQYSPNFANMSFYNANSNIDDLHFDYGWTRNDANVFLDGMNMKARPTTSVRTLWFQTVAMKLTGTDMITFNHLLSNVGGGGSKSLTVSIIDTATLVETTVSTIAYTNASQQTSSTAAVALNDIGIYWIKFTFEHTGSLSSNPVFEIHSFVTTTTPIFLPVVLSNFNITTENNAVKLNWTTISETNSGHFEIFRSDDAVLFQLIGQVSAQGESYVPVDYEFYDYESNFSKVNFYQLIQVDMNGDRQNLGVLRMKSTLKNQEKAITVSTVDQSNILVSRNNSLNLRSEIVLEIKDLKGNTVMTNSLLTEESQKAINMDQLASGIYLIGNPGIGFQKIVLTK